MPNIAFDSSTLISLSQSGLQPVLDFLSPQLEGSFVIPPGVRHESVVHPLHVRKYALSALRTNSLLEKGVLKVSDPAGLVAKSAEIQKIANNLVFVHAKPLSLLQEGEIQCLSLLCLGAAQAIAIDEKTTRMLLESPSTLLERIATEFDLNVGFNERNLRAWYALIPKSTVIRSTELVAVAAARGFFKEYGGLQKQALEGALTLLRDSGCSLTENELEEYSELEDR